MTKYSCTVVNQEGFVGAHLLPDAEELGGALWGRDGELDLVVVHCDPGIQSALVVYVSVHRNISVDKLRNMNSHFGHKLDTHRGPEGHFLFSKKKDNNH